MLKFVQNGNCQKGEKIEMDLSRLFAHNVLIDSINILVRNMNQNGENTEWYKHLKDNRNAIGKFACWVHCFLWTKGMILYYFIN